MKILLPLIFAISLFAGTYDYNYRVDGTQKSTKNLDSFMYGDFKEIIRFDAIIYDGDNLDDKSIKQLNMITNKIKNYKNSNNIRIKIIGHSNKSATKDTDNISKKYADNIKQNLINANIEKSLCIVEYRDNKDMAYTDATSKGRELSNRVMITLYVLNSTK